MPKGNMYLSQAEVRSLLASVDSMLESLPTRDEVFEEDAHDAARDRADYEQLKVKLESHVKS